MSAEELAAIVLSLPPHTLLAAEILASHPEETFTPRHDDLVAATTQFLAYTRDCDKFAGQLLDAKPIPLSVPEPVLDFGL